MSKLRLSAILDMRSQQTASLTYSSRYSPAPPTENIQKRSLYLLWFLSLNDYWEIATVCSLARSCLSCWVTRPELMVHHCSKTPNQKESVCPCFPCLMDHNYNCWKNDWLIDNIFIFFSVRGTSLVLHRQFKNHNTYILLLFVTHFVYIIYYYPPWGIPLVVWWAYHRSENLLFHTSLHPPTKTPFPPPPPPRVRPFLKVFPYY